MPKWDEASLWAKARLYADRADQASAGSPDVPLNYSLALEFLARAALASVHPVLLANPTDDGVSILAAFGYAGRKPPRSVEMKTVYARLGMVSDQFEQHASICEYMTMQRNEELHTGGRPFSPLREPEWLPRFYAACDHLCGFMGRRLAEFVGAGRAREARSLMRAAEGKVIGDAKQRVAAAKKRFDRMRREDRAVSEDRVAFAQVRVLAPGQPLQPATATLAVTCPACGSNGRLIGSLAREKAPVWREDGLVSDTEFACRDFRCSVCQLVLRRAQELAVVGLPTRFEESRPVDPSGLFEYELEDPYMNM